MSYLGDLGEQNAIYRPSSDVEFLQRPTGRTFFTAPGSLTEGRYGLFRWDMDGTGGGAGAHFHRTFSESFYVLSGVVTFFNGERHIDAGAGDFLYVPEGGVHGFANNSGEPASMLVLFAPGAPREEFFRELVEIRGSGRVLSDDQWAEFYARHDQYLV
ncbi:MULTISPECIES: cupin domain-containing protein [unclassified Crossiella]|uniref:cupin domain-containing protein n=1 Tax=unclassified Crossiella TaxID=2620835 RepID=UPI001FFEDE56|nr:MULTISPECIES: cupin domain-containing protein [unclassified Crossiella]MCK2241513.1 cupin domain-containing protein [Crossiella sp. S99.2]MCK2255615.1 cupin domain-containing protein [Crossiella sp. S99.1]